MRARSYSNSSIVTIELAFYSVVGHICSIVMIFEAKTLLRLSSNRLSLFDKGSFY